MLAFGLLYLRFHDASRWSELRELRYAPDRDLPRRADDLVNSALLAGGHEPLPRHAWTTGGPSADHADLATAIQILDRLDPSSGPDGIRDAPIAGWLADDLLSRFAAADGRRGHLTPDSVVRLAVRLTNPIGGERIHDPFCHLGEFLVGAVDHVRTRCGAPAKLKVSGGTVGHLGWLAGMNLTLHDIATREVRVEPPLYRWDTQRRFDLVLTNPPFNMSDWTDGYHVGDLRWRYGIPPRHNANFAWLQHALALLTEGGRAAVLMPHGAGSSENSRERAIRAAMVEDGVVDAVIALPPQLFHSTAIAVTLWLLRGRGSDGDDDVFFVDAHAAGTMDGRNHRVLREEDLERITAAYRDRSTFTSGDVLSRAVARDRLRDDGYVLNPGRYLIAASAPVDLDRNRADADDLRHSLRNLLQRSIDSHERAERQIDTAADLLYGTPAGWSRCQLGEVCDVLAGPSGAVSSGGGNSSDVPVIKPRNISENRIVRDHLDFVDPSVAETLDRYLLAPGDVVCTRTGEIGRCGLVTEEHDGWLLGTSCLRLRPDASLDPSYLVFYLGHPRVQRWLVGNAGGSTVRSLTAATMRALPLLLPDTDRQRRIGAAMGALDEQLAIHDRIRRTTSALRESLVPLYLQDTLLDEAPEEI